jgi:hypothetical protein
MKFKEFDYYIFVDFSENLVGYNILEKDQIKNLLPKIKRFKHYKNADNKKIYLKNVRKTFEREEIKSYFLRFKIKRMDENMSIYLDILEFLKKHENCIIFISIDNRQYSAFRKMINIIDGEKVVVKQESELREGTLEYQLSLVLDNWLNIVRTQNGKL